jgi:hypothetical protein
MRRNADGSLALIPVYIFGIPVGSARISQSGHLEIITGSTSALLKEFKEKLEKGEATGLAIDLTPNELSETSWREQKAG